MIQSTDQSSTSVNNGKTVKRNSRAKVLVSLMKTLKAWIMLGILLSSCAFSKEASFHQKMAKFVPEFDRLNQKVLSQIPVYPGAQEVKVQRGGAHDPLVPTPRTLSVYYISKEEPHEIAEFLKEELITQGWQVEKVEPLSQFSVMIYFQKEYACVTLYVSLWDEYYAMLTGYEPNSLDEPPLSLYDLTILHDLAAVPKAPKPPNSSLFECVPDDALDIN